MQRGFLCLTERCHSVEGSRLTIIRLQAGPDEVNERLARSQQTRAVV